MAREMKDSGVEWIGKCPASWKFLKGKYIFVLRNDRGNTIELQLLSPTQKFGVIPQSLFEELTTNTTVKVKENTDLSQFKTIHKGDFCISLRSFQGGFEYCFYEGVVSPAYQVFYPITKICDNYYKYLFKDQSFISKMNSYTLSLRDGKNIAFADFGSTYLPIPPLSEQEKISSFLDEKCSEIDSLASDIEKQISVLENYKKSIITETVTKGLNPNVEMKDSGVEWIGKIPSNWNKARLKDLCSFGKGLSITKADLCQDGEPVISYGQIHSKTNISTSIKEDLIRFVPSKKCEFCKVSLCSVGDFIFADTSEDKDGCGNFIYVDRKNVFAGYHTIILKSLITPTKFLSYLFQSDDWRYQIRLSANGIKVFSITQKILSSTTVVLPPLREQVEITNYLDKKCSEIDSLISEKKEQLKKLASYKQSMIYEYVTGKKEVPTQEIAQCF